MHVIDAQCQGLLDLLCCPLGRQLSPQYGHQQQSGLAVGIRHVVQWHELIKLMLGAYCFMLMAWHPFKGSTYWVLITSREPGESAAVQRRMTPPQQQWPAKRGEFWPSWPSCAQLLL